MKGLFASASTMNPSLNRYLSHHLLLHHLMVGGAASGLGLSGGKGAKSARHLSGRENSGLGSSGDELFLGWQVQGWGSVASKFSHHFLLRHLTAGRAASGLG